MQRYRSYIEAAFQRSPHRVDDRLLLKRKRHAGGDLKSEEDIRKIHWKRSPLAIFFFTFRNNFIPFLRREKCVQLRRGRRKGGMLFFLCVGLKCKGRNENQLAGRHYLSILVQECIDMRGKTGPLLIQSGLHFSFSFLLPPFSLSISFSRQKTVVKLSCFHAQAACNQNDDV